jgi:hypothetical protein
MEYIMTKNFKDKNHFKKVQNSILMRVMNFQGKITKVIMI